MLFFFLVEGMRRKKKSISTYDASNENGSADLLYYQVLFCCDHCFIYHLYTGYS